MKITTKRNRGFTIVELLVVIVVIGILAAITIVAYTGISGKATVASLSSDLTNAATQLKNFQVLNGSYPTANNCPTPGATEICLKSSNGNTFTYTPNGSGTSFQSFNLSATNSSYAYVMTDSSASVVRTADASGLSCSTGFIPVPGSATYGTADFCVMKYEAKNDGSNNAVSQAAGAPWGMSVAFTPPVVAATASAVCAGCHLITDNEWLTIAQNVLGVASNWDNGAGVHTVGTGYIYNGHSDNSPNSPQAADSNDSNGYYLTGNVAPSGQRRTLTLSNGEVIWDLAGNVYELTSGAYVSGQPGVAPGGSYAYREWTAITNPGTLSPNPSPAATGISGASSWTTANGVGVIFSSADETAYRCPLRGGNYINSTNAGVLMVYLNCTSSWSNATTGFRVAK